MNKRHLHHTWTKLRRIKPWYFLVIALVSTVICVSALRSNNEHMAKLRQAVYAADQNNTDVQGALKQLQSYVTSHMNTSLSGGPNAPYPPIQLKYTYQRLVDAQNQTQGANQLYTEAQHYCEQQDSVDFSGHNRVPCIEQYVQAHGGGQAPASNIPDALYKFDFASPTWSPDLAGWSLLVAVLAWIGFAAALITRKWFKHNT